MGASVGINTTTTVDGDLYVTGNITAFFPSDINLKTHITPIGNPLVILDGLSGNYFMWNENAGESKAGTKDYGVIAQEVEKWMPELVVEDKNGVKKVRYEGLIPLLIEVAKNFSGRIDALEMGAGNAPRPNAMPQYPYPPYPYYPYPPQGGQQPPYPYPYPPQPPQQ